MAKALTTPTAPEAPMSPQISIGERIHGIEDRIEEIESISGMNGISKSRSNSQSEEIQEESEEVAEESQDESVQQRQSTQNQNKTQNLQPKSKSVTNPEMMARDAVANGSGALTKRTTTRGQDEKNADNGNSQSKNQTTITIPPNALLNDDGQSRSERGRAVLNEFNQLDKESQSKSSFTQSSTSSTPKFSHSNNSEYGAAYWLFIVVAVAIMAFFFIRQFANKKTDTPFKPSLATKKAAIDQYNQSKIDSTKIQSQKKSTPTNPPPKIKPVTLKPKSKSEDENKTPHFEVRV